MNFTKQIAPKLPDAAFYDFPGENGTTLVIVRYARQGGNRSYHLVNSPGELAVLVATLPPQASISLCQPQTAVVDDHAYLPDEEGNLTQTSY